MALRVMHSCLSDTSAFSEATPLCRSVLQRLGREAAQFVVATQAQQPRYRVGGTLLGEDSEIISTDFQAVMRSPSFT